MTLRWHSRPGVGRLLVIESQKGPGWRATSPRVLPHNSNSQSPSGGTDREGNAFGSLRRRTILDFHFSPFNDCSHSICWQFQFHRNCSATSPSTLPVILLCLVVSHTLLSTEGRFLFWWDRGVSRNSGRSGALGTWGGTPIWVYGVHYLLLFSLAEIVHLGVGPPRFCTSNQNDTLDRGLNTQHGVFFERGKVLWFTVNTTVIPDVNGHINIFTIFSSVSRILQILCYQNLHSWKWDPWFYVGPLTTRDFRIKVTSLHTQYPCY
jgi:hypothetical protein